MCSTSSAKRVALPAPEAGKLDAFAAKLDSAMADYVADYRDYFERNNARVGGDRIMLDPLPRVFYVAGLGIFGAGGSAKAAKISADIAEATVEVKAKAEGAHGWVPLPEAEMFDVEYWSLEQAKLAKQVEKPLSRQIAVVTGGASGLGLAVAKALRDEGAEVAILDIAADARRRGGEVDRRARHRLRRHRRFRGRSRALAEVVKAFGGVDILISNAGAAFQGSLATVSDEVFEKAFAVNFWSHHYVARAVVRVMEAQKTGGALVFNVSKQAVNPGPDFGPYGASKAALMALMRQYAIEHGASGITSNAVNADRIRTGLMTDEMVAERSKARGVTPGRLHARQPPEARGARERRGGRVRPSGQGPGEHRGGRDRRRRQCRRHAAVRRRRSTSRDRSGPDTPAAARRVLRPLRRCYTRSAWRAGTEDIHALHTR